MNKLFFSVAISLLLIAGLVSAADKGTLVIGLAADAIEGGRPYRRGTPLNISIGHAAGDGNLKLLRYLRASLLSSFGSGGHHKRLLPSGQFSLQYPFPFRGNIPSSLSFFTPASDFIFF
jgi:hypothetical protein